MFILITSCLLLVILPMVAVQFDYVPDLFPTSTTSSSRSTTPDPQSVDGVDGYFDHPSDVEKENQESKSSQAAQRQRKPWDPPIRNSEGGQSMGFRALPKSDTKPPEQDSKAGKSRRPSISPIQSRVDPPKSNPLPQNEPTPLNPSPPHARTRAPPPAIPQRQSPGPSSKDAQMDLFTSPSPKSKSLSIVQTVCITLAFIIFVFAFAILVAHCLAWFIVYKTEARLGEVRKGLLRGGDMRVCLCAH